MASIASKKTGGSSPAYKRGREDSPLAAIDFTWATATQLGVSRKTWSFNPLDNQHQTYRNLPYLDDEPASASRATFPTQSACDAGAAAAVHTGSTRDHHGDPSLDKLAACTIRRNTERVRTVSLFMFHLGAGDGLFVVGVGFVFGLCFLGLVVCLCCCVFGVRLCTICSFIHKL